MQAKPCQLKKIEFKPKRQSLRAWQYRAVDDSLWRACSAPSLIQHNLIKDKLIPEPYFGDNEKLVQWVGEKDWLYRTTFTVDEQVNEENPLYLEFDGLDTYCTISLNGEELGETDNMFRAYRYDISKAVQQGENELVLYFHSPLKKAYPLYLKNGFNYPADNDHAEEHLSPFTRKAPYHYGWDWGMRLLTMGIWRDVRLTHYEKLALRDLSIDTDIEWKGQRAERAKLRLRPEIEYFTKEKVYYSLRLKSPSGELKKFPRQVYDGKPIEFSIDDPELWWTKAWGKQNLYLIEFTLWDKDNNELATEFKILGIRELEFVNEKDELGKSFYFKLNKRPLFIKGANYVPNSQILAPRRSEDFDQLFKSIDFANINMIRVWGGGVYEVDEFYYRADMEGILVWQDFMFACTPYPSNQAFLDNVRAEAVYQVKRLRNHPCLALWCGNNEIKEAIKYWGWQSKFSPKHYEQMKQSYKPLFEELLPEVVKEYAPKQSYIHGSPMEANWGRPKSFTYGDSHYWGLWYGQEDFSTFDNKPLRFVSEFGFQAFPTMKTIQTFAKPEDYDLNSAVMTCHQKASTGNALIKKYMERDYRVPYDFADFVYMNNVLQMEGMEYVMRTLRRQRPTCMGALYWQLNDSWASISWSGIDYLGNYKGLHYAARRAFAPVNLSTLLDEEGLFLKVFVNNDLLQEQQNLKIRYTFMDFYGNNVERGLIPLPTIKANASTELNSFAVFRQAKNRVLCLELWTGEKLMDRIFYYRAKSKDLTLPKAEYTITYECKKDGQAKLYIKAKTLVKNLFVDLPIQGLFISDNYFDLLPNEERVIELRSPELRKGKPMPIFSCSMQEVVARIPYLCKEPAN